MEVGAVKQAFNNEVILLKKKLNQAKIQIIHKLTRKAKQLTEKKAPEPLKEKLKRKAESAVKEVLIIKKIKAKDIAKFTVTHKGELNSFLNKPQVDNDKACARLLLHKALQDKYKFIRGRFSNVPIQDLFMSRLERRKMKKEAKEKQKNKKKGKDSKVVNSEGDWNVEDVEVEGNGKLSDDNSNAMSDDDHEILSDNGASGNERDHAEVGEASDEDDDNEILSDDGASGNERDHAEVGEASDEDDDNKIEDQQNGSLCESEESHSDERDDDIIIKPSPKVKAPIKEVEIKEFESKKPDLPKEIPKITPTQKVVKKNPEKKMKELNKSTKFNEKIHQKKIKIAEGPTMDNKIVDPFFITSTGENYMSVVEPRAPDEVKDEHMQGNRRLRRAVMFGHVPKSKLRQNNNYHEENRFNKHNSFDKFKSNSNDRPQYNDRKSFNNDLNNKRGFNNRNDRNRNDVEEKPEKLHPSWEAKKKKSGILPFEGKKIIFDDS